MDYKKIAELISKSQKTTPSTVYIQGNFKKETFRKEKFKVFGENPFWILIGDHPEIEKWMNKNREGIRHSHIDINARHSALPLLDYSRVEARIEPGAVIRKGARIGKDSIIMMGAVINIGAEIGERTMVDMNAVIGARAMVGKDSHIGAGAVLAGVLEPPSEKPVQLEDKVLVGANAVVLEGVSIGKGSVVAAGAVVLEDVPPGYVVAGVPARKIREVKDIPKKEKIALVKELRRLKSK
ncbi:MAG: 2,3,4,5-tetrahydropyridine-2,6-dicarboxylate N-acetyltransferase [Candidatus Aminicenantes bacterium]